jgi:hypothetical protein
VLQLDGQLVGITDDLQVKIRRRVLHAYYNQLQRITWNGSSKKPKFQLSSSEAMLGREVLEKADATLQQMERHSREYVTKARGQNKIMRPLLDANDYVPLIMGYNQVGSKAIPALHAMRRLTDLFERSDYLERLAPTTSLYLAVSKAIFNYKDEQDWLDRMGKSQMEFVGSLCKECVEYSRQVSNLIQTEHQLVQRCARWMEQSLATTDARTKYCSFKALRERGTT